MSETYAYGRTLGEDDEIKEILERCIMKLVLWAAKWKTTKQKLIGPFMSRKHNKNYYFYLANMLIIKAVPLIITKRFYTGIIMATSSTSRMNHDRKELIQQRTLWREEKGVKRTQ